MYVFRTEKFFLKKVEKKISDANIGRHCTDETKLKIAYE
jgi:hypothetical protein